MLFINSLTDDEVLNSYNFARKSDFVYSEIISNLNFKNIELICNNFIEGLQWNIKYYLEECPSYDWYYEYRAAPLMKDLTKFLLNRVYPKEFEDNIEYSSLEQLSIVLPMESKYLWSCEYINTVNKDIILQSFYPKNYRIDTVNKIYLHQCEPILMNIDSNYIRDIVKKIKLTDFEKKRTDISGLKIYNNQKENIKIQLS